MKYSLCFFCKHVPSNAREALIFDEPCDNKVLPRGAIFILGDENLISSSDVKPKLLNGIL